MLFPDGEDRGALRISVRNLGATLIHVHSKDQLSSFRGPPCRDGTCDHQKVPAVGHTNSNDHPSSVSALPDRSRLCRQPLRIFRESEPASRREQKTSAPSGPKTPKRRRRKGMCIPIHMYIIKVIAAGLWAPRGAPTHSPEQEKIPESRLRVRPLAEPAPPPPESGRRCRPG